MDKKPPLNKKALHKLVFLSLNSILFFTLYRLLLFYAEKTMKPAWSLAVMVLYLALLLGFGLGYMIYNRFFYRKGLTPEELCPDWSEEEKAAFLADGEVRLQRSEWMLLIILPLIFTFFIDTVDLFIIDTLFR
jgi:hypothetical protein